MNEPDLNPYTPQSIVAGVLFVLFLLALLWIGGA